MAYRKLLAMAGAMMLLGMGAHAQLGMKLEAEQNCYLRYERVKLRLTVRNYSGNTLVFGGENSTEQGKLTFVIRRQSGQLVKCLDPSANPMEDIILAPGLNRQLVLDINTLFDMQRPDVYKIEARISHHRLAHDCASEPIIVVIKRILSLNSFISIASGFSSIMF